MTLALGLALVTTAAQAERVAVPLDVQAKLLAKVARYDKNLKRRADGTVRIVVLERDDDASKRASAQLLRELGAIDEIGELPVEVRVLGYSGPEALAQAVREKKLSIVYVTPGFAQEVPKIAEALSGVDVLSVAAVDNYVDDRIVLGFELIGGKPKLLLHLPQAKSQHVEFSSSVLKLMKVKQ